MADSSSSASSRLKLLCSFGGKILPRSPEGHLKYIGGETRVLVLPRPLSFSELREKIAAVCDADVIVKYQLTPDDLEALVTVRSDEDVRHMIEEYDRLEDASSPTSFARFRLLLFPCAGGPPARRGHRRVDSQERRYRDTFKAAAAEPPSIPSNRLRAVHKAHSSPNLQQLSECSQWHPPHHHHHLHGGPPARASGLGGRAGATPGAAMCTNPGAPTGLPKSGTHEGRRLASGRVVSWPLDLARVGYGYESFALE